MKNMGTILIQADKKSNKILSDLAKKLGGTVVSLKDKELEDVLLGQLMDSEKTGEQVSRNEIFDLIDKK